MRPEIAGTSPTRLHPSLGALEHVAREEGWGFEIVDPFSGQFVRVRAGERQFFAGIGRVHSYPLNSSVSASIARDKAFTYQAVAHAGLNVPPYGYFFLHGTHGALRGPGRERSDAFAYALSLGYPVFVKPIDGARGARADIAYSSDDLEAVLREIGAVHHAALIQPVLTGEDRRIFVLDGAAIFGYRRERARLTGDGAAPLGTLLDRYNAGAAAVGITPIADASPFLREALAARGVNLASVLKRGEEFFFAARGNVSAGGSISDFDEHVPHRWADWANRVVNALGLRVAAVDFFAPDREAPAEELKLIEVNSNPSLSGIIALGRSDIAHHVWRHAGQRYFAECTRASA